MHHNQGLTTKFARSFHHFIGINDCMINGAGLPAFRRDYRIRWSRRLALMHQTSIGAGAVLISVA
jgi:hypothetical protein